MDFGLIDALRHEMAHGQRVQGELKRQGRKRRLDHVGDVVVELVEGVQHLRPFQGVFLELGGVNVLVARVFLDRCALGVTQRVPGRRLRQDHAAIHIQAVDLERRVEGVQQRCVIAVAHILRIQLPVVVDDLRVVADDLVRLGEVALDQLAHGLAQIVLNRRRIGAERAEDQAVVDRDPQRLQPVLGQVEVLRHAALAGHTVLERHAAQLPGHVIGPGVVDAGHAFLITALLQANQRAFVGAAVDHGVDMAVAVAGDYDRDFTDDAGLEVAILGHFDLQAEIMPRSTAEDALMLQTQNFRVVIDAVWNARRPLRGPDQRLAERVGGRNDRVGHERCLGSCGLRLVDIIPPERDLG